ncbi:MAG: signal peptidase I [Clostridium sp.]
MKEKLKTVGIDIIIAVAIISVLILIFKLSGYFKVEISSNSMMPILEKGDIVLGKLGKEESEYKRGDLIIFYSDEFNQYLVKRIIGVPDDKIKIEEGQVYINGELIKEKYVKNCDKYHGEFVIPNDSYFVLGDNRSNSFDSRYFKSKFIHKDNIYGKAIRKVYPFNEILEEF